VSGHVGQKGGKNEETHFKLKSRDKECVMTKKKDLETAELCRREGIHATIYYKWQKEFLARSLLPQSSEVLLI